MCGTIRTEAFTMPADRVPRWIVAVMAASGVLGVVQLAFLDTYIWRALLLLTLVLWMAGVIGLVVTLRRVDRACVVLLLETEERDA